MKKNIESKGRGRKAKTGMIKNEKRSYGGSWKDVKNK